MSPNSVYWIDWHRPTWLLWQPVFAMHVCSSFSANQFVSICIVLRTTLVYRSLIAISFCKCYSYFGCNRFNLSIALCRFTFAIPFFLLTQSARSQFASMHLGSSHDCVCWLCWYKTLAIHICVFIDRFTSINFLLWSRCRIPLLSFLCHCLRDQPLMQTVLHNGRPLFFVMVVWSSR